MRRLEVDGSCSALPQRSYRKENPGRGTALAPTCGQAPLDGERRGRLYFRVARKKEGRWFVTPILRSSSSAPVRSVLSRRCFYSSTESVCRSSICTNGPPSTATPWRSIRAPSRLSTRQDSPNG